MVQCFSCLFALELNIRCICFLLVTVSAVRADEVQSGEFFLQLMTQKRDLECSYIFLQLIAPFVFVY